MVDTEKKLNDEQTVDNTNTDNTDTQEVETQDSNVDTTNTDTTATDSANTDDTNADTTANTDDANADASNTDTDTTANTDDADTQEADNADDADNADAQESVEAQIAELYIATFDRAPDAAGLEYWVEQYQNGMSIEEIAQSFFDQPETKQKYGDGDVESFIESVYENVLDREPDEAGLEYWKGELENGNISKNEFILAILNGAKEHEGDAKHLMDKTEVGLEFVKEGLNDAELAKAVIEQFKVLGDKEAVKEAIKEFASKHKGDDKIDDSDIQEFSKLAQDDHMELMKQDGNFDGFDYGFGNGDDNVDSTYTSGDDSANTHQDDDQVQLVGADSSDDSADSVSSGGAGGGMF